MDGGIGRLTVHSSPADTGGGSAVRGGIGLGLGRGYNKTRLMSQRQEGRKEGRKEAVIELLFTFRMTDIRATDGGHRSGNISTKRSATLT